MRIQLASDLHLETRDGQGLDDLLDAPAVDVVVLAGDIATGTHGVEAAATLSAAREVPVIYVLGNHEYYGWHFPRLADACREAALVLRQRDRGEVHVLEREQVRIGGVRILGTTLWTDYRLNTWGDTQLVARNRKLAARELADHHFIHSEDGLFRPEHAQRAHYASREWLERNLAAPWDGPTVVVTHHAPLPQLGHPDFPGDGLASAFSSDLGMLVRQHPPALWLSGHTHANADLTFHGTRFVANQAGYPAERPGRINGAGFDRAKIVTVG